MTEEEKEIEELTAQIEAVLDAAQANDLDAVYDNPYPVECIHNSVRCLPVGFARNARPALDFYCRPLSLL